MSDINPPSWVCLNSINCKAQTEELNYKLRLKIHFEKGTKIALTLPSTLTGKILTIILGVLLLGVSIWNIFRNINF